VTPTTWLTPREASAYTKLSVISLRRATQAGRLRAFRIGRSVRYRQHDIDQWLSSTPMAKEAF
jgi:excisionase family DNA binding protein